MTDEQTERLVLDLAAILRDNITDGETVIKNAAMILKEALAHSKQQGIEEGLAKRLADIDKDLLVKAITSNKEFMHKLGQEAAEAYFHPSTGRKGEK